VKRTLDGVTANVTDAVPDAASTYGALDKPGDRRSRDRGRAD
jgi:hypothetical protein